MRDRAFLIWLHEQLVNLHGEHPSMDYMRRLRAIIKMTPADRETPNVWSGNSIEELLEQIKPKHEN